MVTTPSPHIGSIAVPETRPEGPAAHRSSRMISGTPAIADDAVRVVDVIAEAFLHHQMWSWAFPDPGPRRRSWEVCTAGTLSRT